jgi:hypothetical protein
MCEFQRNARGEIKPSLLNTVIALDKLEFRSSRPLDRMRNIDLRCEINSVFGFAPSRQTVFEAARYANFVRLTAAGYSSAAHGGVNESVF